MDRQYGPDYGRLDTKFCLNQVLSELKKNDKFVYQHLHLTHMYLFIKHKIPKYRKGSSHCFTFQIVFKLENIPVGTWHLFSR